MFALTMGAGVDFAFPDVCLTPIVVPVPIPYPNISESITTQPAETRQCVKASAAPSRSLHCWVRPSTVPWSGC